MILWRMTLSRLRRYQYHLQFRNLLSRKKLKWAQYTIIYINRIALQVHTKRSRAESIVGIVIYMCKHIRGKMSD